MIRPAIAALLLPIAGPAVAQQAPGSAPAVSSEQDGELEARFAGMDRDGDGAVSQAEFTLAATDGMRRLAANGGPAAGAVGTAGLSLTAARAIDGLFAKLDGNGDGSLSLAEVRSGRDRMRVE